MKVKKVEISAFRIFEDVKDATFDFRLNNGEPANFVSLYAPNGFGKTSFYDAVEWCMTNNVHRFWQNERVTKESLNAMNELPDNEKITLLKNTNAAKKTIPYVTIETETGINKRELRVHGKRKNDINDHDYVENGEFRSVILSQEWISGFLKESNGEDRYKLFMKNPGLLELDEYYSQLFTLIAANNESAGALQKDINDIRKKYQVINDDKLLDTINYSIKILIAKNEPLSLIEITTSDKDALSFGNKINERLTDIESGIKGLDLIIINIGYAKTGNDHIIGIELYFQQLSNKAKLDAELVQINKILDKFSLFSKIKNEQAVAELKSTDTAQKAKSFEEILAQFSIFENTERSINDNIGKRQIETNSLTTLATRLNEIKTNEAEVKARLETTNQRILVAEDKLKKFPDFKTIYAALKSQIEASEIKMKQLDNEIAISLENKKLLERLFTEYRDEIEKLRNQQFDRLLNIPTEFVEVVAVLRDTLLSVQREIANIRDIDSKIERQQNLNNEIAEFINKGLQIVNNTQSNNCPLCTHEYKNYEELAQKIASNTLLDLAIQNLLTRKNTSQAIINKASEEIKIKSQSIIVYYENLVAGQDRLLQTANNQLAEYRNVKTNLDNSTSQDRVNLQHMEGELKGLTISDYEKQLSTDFQQLKEDQKKLSGSIDAIEKDLKQAEGNIDIINNRVKVLQTELEQLRGIPQHLAISNWFQERGLKDISKQFLQDEQERLLKEQQNALDEIKEIHERQRLLTEDLKNYTVVQQEERKKILENDKTGLQQKIDIYELFVFRELSIAVKNLSKEIVMQNFAQVENNTLEEIKSLRELYTEYLKLVEYNKNLLPFLQSEKQKIVLSDKEAKLNFLQNQVYPFLDKERTDLKKYLEKRIEGFFHKYLINQLYNKIDPHPDFRGVEFRANFGSANPSLDVLVTNADNEQKLIPNLYFSTAQINILSLSIFLASALNSKEYQCIFIDDPIQSMDSINVLSTIDLLRSLVVNEGKQIILSTHDENFHNLLKKKMPPDLFESKFLELESFGKVKQG